jgi:carbon starvation protein
MKAVVIYAEMHAFPLMLGALAIFAIAYRFYSAFISARVLALDDARTTPAYALNDGHNYHPTHPVVLFGHHFAAISGAGPLIGPVLAMQFGYMPGFFWIVIGVCVGGAVQDFVILAASVRRNGRSLAEIARTEISPLSGLICSIAIIFIVIIALAGLGLAVVNALSESAWGVVTVGATIPIALGMGVYLYFIRKGRVLEASLIGVAGLIIAVVAGKEVAQSSFAQWFVLERHSIMLLMGIYGFVASVLPVWLLLCPRDYLSSFMKLGTIAFLVLGVLIVNPPLLAPSVSSFAAGGGPIVPGALFPFLFITIACGAISGFHALISSGTTPKMLSKETHARPIGYGCMLLEALVGVTALIAAASLHPGDYFAINTTMEKFAGLGMSMVNLHELEQQIGEAIAGRPGGAVSLAVGMAQIFSGLPGMRTLVSYWYHFAIMFEALFIMSTIDTGTRVARFLIQEFLGRFSADLAKTDSRSGALLATAFVVFGWVYFLWTGSIDTIWPMFGIANQLLAAVALCVGTSVLINAGRGRFAFITIVPLAIVTTTTLSAGWLSVTDRFFPMARLPGKEFQGYLNAVVTLLMMACVLAILIDAVPRWLRVAVDARRIVRAS